MASIPVKKPYREGRKFGAWLWYGRHKGQDYLPAVPGAKDKVYSPVAGVVTQYVGGACHGMDIKDKKGDIHRLCHLTSRVVRPGNRVKEKQHVGKMSNEGLSRGVHVHWAVIRNGRAIDPLKTLTGSNLDDLRASINGLFRAIFHRAPSKADNDYFLSRIGRNIFDLGTLINKMKFWAAQPKQAWLKERKKVLGR